MTIEQQDKQKERIIKIVGRLLDAGLDFGVARATDVSDVVIINVRVATAMNFRVCVSKTSVDVDTDLTAGIG